MYFAGTLYWVVNVMAEHGGLSTWVAVLVSAGLVAVMASFVAAFAWIVRHLAGVAGPQALLAAPLVWVATELGRTYLYTGFPWVLVGYSQSEVLPIAQLASVVGVYGLSALVVAVSAALAAWGLDIVAPGARDGRVRLAGADPRACADSRRALGSSVGELAHRPFESSPRPAPRSA